MAVDLLLGLQWGDEGKGKIVDVLTADYDIIARFQGGPMLGTRWNLMESSMFYAPSRLASSIKNPSM